MSFERNNFILLRDSIIRKLMLIDDYEIVNEDGSPDNILIHEIKSIIINNNNKDDFLINLQNQIQNKIKTIDLLNHLKINHVWEKDAYMYMLIRVEKTI